MHSYKNYNLLGIGEKVSAFGEEVLASLKDTFDKIDRIAEENQIRVLHAFQEAKIGEAHLSGTTGYGYNDLGREGLEKVYALYFHTEDALVRPQIVSGTHALHLALSGNLRPGDTLLSVSGRPYDTLEEVIGIRPSEGSLADYGVAYREVDLIDGNAFDHEAIAAALQDASVKLVAIQRSKGYLSRRSLSVTQIGEAIRRIKAVRPDVLVMVDNCYGEFVELTEPSDVGADLVVGSLIKNPGGGLAPTGGYLAGTKEAVDRAAARLTAPGLGKEVGATLGVLPALYQGFFLAPSVTASALKGAVFAAACYEQLGFTAIPGAGEERTDIIQAVTFPEAEALLCFCRGIQEASPVDSFVRADPAPMPGYDVPVIMAAGTFISGSSIELSADAPFKEPYTVFFQGGLTFTHAKCGILKTLQNLLDRGYVNL